LFTEDFPILPKGQCSALKGHGGLITIFLAMLGLVFVTDKLEKVEGQGFAVECCGNCCERRDLDDDLAGLARPSSSRAIFSIFCRIGL